MGKNQQKESKEESLFVDERARGALGKRELKCQVSGIGRFFAGWQLIRKGKAGVNKTRAPALCLERL